MPHVDARVGHGGFGTTMTALSYGVPQVVVPLSPTAVATLVAEPAYRAAARSVAAEVAAHAPVSEAARLIEELAASAARP